MICPSPSHIFTELVLPPPSREAALPCHALLALVQTGGAHVAQGEVEALVHDQQGRVVDQGGVGEAGVGVHGGDRALLVRVRLHLGFWTI